jgi:chaperone modulatory protein CbpM
MNASDENSLSGEVIDERSLLTVDELCRLCAVERTSIVEMVEEGVLSVELEFSVKLESTEWRFAGASLRRARTALRLQRDLEINLPGVALALDLLEQLEHLRRQLNLGRV